MTGLLIFIKHKLPFFWNILDKCNGFLFLKRYRFVFDKELKNQLQNFRSQKYTYRQLTINDSQSLFNLLQKQTPQRIKYFKPHGFDLKSITKLFSNQSLILLGVFEQTEMVGYFFLRCFINKKCFVGRLVDEAHSNQGIGKSMNRIMYHTGWNCGFRVMSTISTNNELVLQSHKNNDHYTITGNLPDNYLLIEFRKATKKQNLSMKESI